MQNRINIIAQTHDNEIIWHDSVREDIEVRTSVLTELRKLKIMPLASTLFQAAGILWRVQVDQKDSVVRISYSSTQNEGVYYK